MAASFLRRCFIAFALYPLINATISKTCPSADICYSLNIPDSTASSGQGDVYFQISAPTTYEWVALGQGSQMLNANMFIMYTSSSGQNVTVSARHGAGHIEPQTTDATSQITLLEGSGVANGTMTANVRCSNCNAWQGGSMDFSASSATWIHAAKSGQPLNSDDINEQITMHDAMGSFDWDFTAARGGDSSVNPFLSQSQNQTATPGATSQGSAYPPKITNLHIAHGVMASLAWVIFFPTGAIVLRFVPSAHVTWIHAAIQAFGYMIFIAAFGMGVYLARQYDALNYHHPIIGIVVFILASSQPISGLLHHYRFIKTRHRNIWSVFHLTFGRIAVVLGIINGGLGLQWAGNASTGQVAAYGVLAGIFGAAFLAALVYGEISRRSNKRVESLQSSEDREK